MRTTIRIAWLIAVCLIVARTGKAICDYVLWHLGFAVLALPGRYEFVRWLNACTLLAVSIALGCTCAWLIEDRFVPRLRTSSRTANVKPQPESVKTSDAWWNPRTWWNALRKQWIKEGRQNPSAKYWMIGFVVLCAIYGALKGCAEVG